MSKITLAGVTLDSADFRQLANFYIKLLGGKVAHEFGDAGLAISAPGCPVQLTFQNAVGYQPPVWPEEAGKAQQMEHLDFVVDNIEAAVKHALDCGAQKAAQQFIPGIVVMLDPAGHPFCLIPEGH